MQTHREREEEVAGLWRKSVDTVRDGPEIRTVIVEGEARESESWGSLPLIVIRSEEETGFDEEFAEDFMQGLRLEPIEPEHDEEDEGDKEDEELEFAFVCENPDGSLISAEEAFQDGRIKPFYPVFGRNIFLEEDASQSSSSSSSSSVLRGILVGNPSSSSSSSSSLDGGDPLEGLAEGTYCVWRMGRAAGKTGEGGAKGVCRKSNSTGFSKLWRVKELVMRSNSNGKDAFVFLNPKKAKDNTLTKSDVGKAKAVTIGVRKGGHHGHECYVRSDNNRRRSYLPYKVGFFTNMNGMSRNVVHPY